MQIGQVPTMFYPAAPVVDTTATTVPDANAQAMFPDQFLPEPVAAAAPDCFFCDTTRNWLMAGAAVVIFWAMRPRRR